MKDNLNREIEPYIFYISFEKKFHIKAQKFLKKFFLTNEERKKTVWIKEIIIPNFTKKIFISLRKNFFSGRKKLYDFLYFLK